MNQAIFRFYAELGDFLDRTEAGAGVNYKFWGAPAVKDAIEAIGVPHPEVDLILINGQPVPFEMQLQSSDRVSVYPAFRQIELPARIRLSPEPLAVPTFIADIHLGQLCRYLRMVGFSCLYSNDSEDAKLAQISAEQDRILLTRDQELLKRSIVQRGYYVRSDRPKHQLAEVAARFKLAGQFLPFRRCMECDGELIEVPKAEVVDQLPENVRLEQQEFRQCGRCQQVYWSGSHVERMRELISWLRGSLDEATEAGGLNIEDA